MLCLRIVAFRFLAECISSGLPALPLLFFFYAEYTCALQNKTITNVEYHCASGFMLHLYTGCHFDCHRTHERQNAAFPPLRSGRIFLSVLANAGIAHRSLDFSCWNCTVPFYAGAVLGILFPVWNVYPPFHYMTIHGFVYHALIILYPWLLFVSGNIRPKTRHIWQPVLLLCGIVPPVYLLTKNLTAIYVYQTYRLKTRH